MNEEQLPISPLAQELQGLAAEAAPSSRSDTLPSSTGLGEWLKQLFAVTRKQKVEEHFAQQIDGAGLRQVAIQTTSGAIDYVGDAQQQTITIQVHKVVKAPEAATAEAFARQVAIHVEPQAGALRIYHTYPKPPRHVEVAVSFLVNGPSTMDVHGRSTNGQVALRQVTGMVQAESTNGELRLAEINGAVTARCTNGNISAKRMTLTDVSKFSSQNGNVGVDFHQGQATITATTVNGSVHLTLPPDYQGQLDARTQNGQVRTTVQPQITTRVRNRLVGQIGGGGEALLELQSQNGDVTLAAAAT